MLGIQDKFVDYFSAIWTSQFNHAYKISSHSSWKGWSSKNPDKIWSCNTLEGAYRNYSWGSDIESTNYLVAANKLKIAIKLNDSIETAKQCYEIFHWGGVSRKKNDISRLWIQRHEEQKDLPLKIMLGVKKLLPISSSSLDGFDGSNLLMNSSMTKIYAAADPDESIVIYDGRVGAALGLIVRIFLERNHILTVPDDLDFMWGSSASVLAQKRKTRDPSKAPYFFKKLPNTSTNPKSDFIRAALSRKTNIYLKRVSDKLRTAGIIVSPHDLEKSLFMLGYDVSTSVY